jgi:hypothetical protein
VPTEYGPRQVLLKAFVWEVVIRRCVSIRMRHSA